MTSIDDNSQWGSGGPRKKIILGIDYGTTYSGISYVSSDKSSIHDINTITSWPGGANSNGYPKTPSRLAYAVENRGMQHNRWGFQVDPDHKSYSWTKLQLDSNARAADYDDPSLTTLTGQSMMELPSFRTAAGVCEDFLRELYTFTRECLRKDLGDHVLNKTTFECWVTLPSIWSEEAKHATLDAARNAGFASGPNDMIFTIAEPEAAALATLTAFTEPSVQDPIKTNEHVLVCDCGGGTVDVTTYTITQVNPHLGFDELCIGVGGKCGSTYIDRNLHSLLSSRFGTAFTELPYSRKGPGSIFMRAFEEVKSDFGDDLDVAEYNVGPIDMGLEDSELYDSDEGNVILSDIDMKGLFDPVVQEIIHLVEDQVDRAKNRKGAKINRLILVGGFGASLYLQGELRKWCMLHGDIMLVCPPKPQSAIAIGAALRGLEGLAPRLKYARKHYGFSWALPFRPGRDDQKHAYIDEFDNAKLCTGMMNWAISKGESVFKDEHRCIPVVCSYTPGKQFSHPTRLYSSPRNEAPERFDNPNIEFVGCINTKFPEDYDFGEALLSTYNTRLEKMVYRIRFNVEVVFGDRGDNLQFRTTVNGVVGGTTSVLFTSPPARA